MFALNLIKLITMKKLLLSLAIALVSVSSFAQTTVYVNQAATGTNNGTSWTNAYTSLRIALLNATANSQIWVAAGTYKPYVNSRADFFNINTGGLKIYGGFAGNETALNQRIFGSNETILSGDINGNDTGTPDYTNTSYSENSYNVVTVAFGGLNITLDRLTIKGGCANGPSGQDLAPGINMTSTSNTLTLQNCKVVKNVSKTSGALSNSSPCVLSINACEFTENVAGYGAGVYVGTYSQVDISNCLFANNKAVSTAGPNGYAGSAVWLANYSATTLVSKLINCTFANNSDQGTYSGMTNLNRSPVVLSRAATNIGHISQIHNCLFWGNTNPGGVSPSISKANDILAVSSIVISNTSDESSFIGVVLAPGSGNNNNSNPLFVNAGAGNFQLTLGSPAINTGTNSQVVGSADLLNNQRIFNTTVDRGAFEFGSIPASINELNTINEVAIYPNPSSSMINIKTEKAIEIVYVYNTLGAIVLEEKNSSFSVEHLPTGIYTLQIKTVNGMGITRFVKN
jgi:hypothetical protein